MSKTYKSPDCGANRKYVFRAMKGRSLNFRVKAMSNVNLCLSPSTSEVPHQQYEVFIGGWKGDESAIRRNKKDDVQRVQTPDILNSNQFKGFWIVVTDHSIKVGKEGQAQPFLVHSDAAVRMNISYYGYCTAYGSTGVWTFGDDVASTTAPGFNMSSVADAISQVVVAPKNAAVPQLQPSAPPSMYPAVPSYPKPGYPVGGYPTYNHQPTPSIPQIHPITAFPQNASLPYAAHPQNARSPYSPDISQGLRWVSCNSVSMCPSPVIGVAGKQTAYVALAYHEGGLIPGIVITPSLDICVIPYGGKAISKASFYLLSNPSNIELVWIKASKGEVPTGALQGGYSEKSEPLYIGRISRGFEYYCGKIHPSSEVCYAPRNGREIDHWNYEVLCIKTVPMSLLGL